MKKKKRLSKTAQVNLLMLADLGIPEAVHFQNVLQFSHGVLDVLRHIPMASSLPVCISMVSEILYERTNELIRENDHPIILDLACGYSPRVLRVCDSTHIYVGVDLPDVIEELRNHREALLSFREETATDYYSVDLTNYDEFRELMKQLQGEVTVITQGLLTYLTPDQKQVLMDNIRSLLETTGGCWIIPDSEPARLLPELFQAVLGEDGAALFQQVMAVLDTLVKRDRNKNGWRSADEICTDLVKNGFQVQRVSLFSESLTLYSLHQVSQETAQKIIENWQTTDALIITANTKPQN